MIAPGLGLPPGIDDGAAVVADLLAVPHPGLGVDRLADGAQQAQRGQRVLFHVLVAPLDEGADGRGRGVEERHLVVVDDLPEARKIRPVGRALVHQHRGAVLQRPIDHIGMAGDPADVGRAPVDVLVSQVEDIFSGEVGLHSVGALADDGMGQLLALDGASGRTFPDRSAESEKFPW